jgi:hypothetical protein
MFEQGDDISMDMATPPPSEQSNRTFIIAAGILAGVVFISIVCMALYALVYLPQQKAGQSAQQATIEAQNALIAEAMTQTLQAGAIATQSVPTNAPATQTLAPVATQTPVIAEATSSDPTALLEAYATQTAIAAMGQIVTPQATLSANQAITATWSALNTQVANNLLTATVTPGGSMPTSGFADEVGLPGLMVMAIALVVVILLARRLRTAPMQ